VATCRQICGRLLD